MKLPIINTSGYPNPAYAHRWDSGMDIRTCINEPKTLQPLERFLFPTGIRIDVPGGFEIQIRSRSGLALKHGVTVLNTPGIWSTFGSISLVSVRPQTLHTVPLMPF